VKQSGTRSATTPETATHHCQTSTLDAWSARDGFWGGEFSTEPPASPGLGCDSARIRDFDLD
jgi:hypothetical protein